MGSENKGYQPDSHNNLRIFCAHKTGRKNRVYIFDAETCRQGTHPTANRRFVQRLVAYLDDRFLRFLFSKEATKMIAQEEWRSVVGYEGIYEVSSMGWVRSLDRVDSVGRKRTGKILSPAISEGYPFVQLSNGGSKVVRVHCLVAAAFLGEVPDGHEVNHIDTNKLNNRSDNLEYVTRQRNIQHAAENELMGGKLSADQVRWVRDVFTSNPRTNVAAIAHELGVSDKIIRNVLRVQCYRTISNTDGSKPKPIKTTLTVEDILGLRASGMKMSEIARHFGAEASTAYQTLRRAKLRAGQ